MSVTFTEKVAIARRIARISREADVTKLDVVGLPVYQVFRPFSRNYVVSQGKGARPEDALLSAIMESLEFFHGEGVYADTFASPAALQPILPYRIETLPMAGGLDYEAPRHWTRVVELRSERETYVPYDLISLDFSRDGLEANPFRNTSNGYGGGSTIEHALLHAVLEVVERHIVSTGIARRIQVDLDVYALLSPFISVFRSAGIKIAVHAFDSPLGLPTFKVTVYEAGTGLAFSGTCTRFTKDEALKSAFYEAVQSRLTHITGARDDLTQVSFDLKAGFLMPEGGGTGTIAAPVRYAEVPERSGFSDAGASCAALFDILERAGFSKVLAKDLTRADIDIPFVVAVVPGLVFNWGHIV
jgi:ribosomal protein S12 methylthiotransferase accessory factor